MRFNELITGLSRHPESRIHFFAGGKVKSRRFDELQQDALSVAGKLRARGLTRDVHVAVLADNEYSWLVHDLALLEIGCRSLAITSELLALGADLLADKHGIDVFLGVGATAEATMATLPEKWFGRASSDEPFVRRPRNQSAASTAGLSSFDGLTSEEAPLRVFSSGSTGVPRAIVVSRQGLDDAMEGLARDYDVGPNDTVLLFLPVANLQQRLIAYAALAHGVSIVITDPVGLFTALQQARPTILLAPPIFYESVARRVTAGRGGWVLRALLAIARFPPTQGPIRALLRPIGRRVGTELGGRLRLMITGMAPISRAALDALTTLGLPVYEAYGMTELGIIACNTPQSQRRGSVGRPARGVRIDVVDGELIVTRTPALTLGYEGVDEADCRGTYLVPGRVATGDVGRIDKDGFLYLLGRKKNVIVTSDGRKLHPESLEREIAAAMVIGQCAVVPAGVSSVACVAHVTSNSSRAAAAARSHIERCVQEHGGGLALERIIFVPEPFSIRNGLLTSNLKLNRPALRERVVQADA